MNLQKCEEIFIKMSLNKQQELYQQSSKENSKGSHYAGGSYLMSNLMSELDIEESKEESNFHDNDSFIIQDTSKRKIDILSSASSRLESPNSTNERNIASRKYKQKETSNSSTFAANRQPSIHNFKAIRNAPGKRVQSRYLINNPIAQSPIVGELETEPPLASSCYRLKLSDETTLKLPFGNDEVGNMIDLFFNQNNVCKRPSRSRQKQK